MFFETIAAPEETSTVPDICFEGQGETRIVREIVTHSTFSI